MKSVHCCFAGHRDYLNAEKGGPGGGEGRSFFDVSSNKSNSKACFTPIEIFDCIQSETANSGQVCAPFSPTQMEPSNAFMHHRRRRVRTDKKSSK